MKKTLLSLGALAVFVGILVIIRKPLPTAPIPGAPQSSGGSPASASTSPQPVAITWSPLDLTQTIFPGAGVVATASFSSNENLSAVVIDAAPSLGGVAAVSPANFPAIVAGQAYQLTLTLTAPPVLAQRSFGGTIHIRDAANTSTIYNKPLPVAIQVGWASVTNASSGISMALPLLGNTPPAVFDDAGSASSGTGFMLDIAAVNTSENTACSVARVFSLANPSRDDLRTWFEQNVDDAAGTLLASGAFQPEQLPNGPALVDAGPIPSNYEGAPVAQAYEMTSPGGPVYAITQAQDCQLTDFGYAPSSVPTILTLILGSVQ